MIAVMQRTNDLSRYFQPYPHAFTYRQLHFNVLPRDVRHTCWHVSAGSITETPVDASGYLLAPRKQNRVVDRQLALGRNLDEVQDGQGVDVPVVIDAGTV